MENHLSITVIKWYAKNGFKDFYIAHIKAMSLKKYFEKNFGWNIKITD